MPRVYECDVGHTLCVGHTPAPVICYSVNRPHTRAPTMYAHMFYHAHTYYVLTMNLEVSCEQPGRYLLAYPRGYTHPFPARYTPNTTEHVLRPFKPSNI